MARVRRVRLIHWKAEECPEREARLRDAGCTHVDASPCTGPPALRALAEAPPEAVVIDLGRLPSQGREVGVHLRMRKGTRAVPLVFVDGAPEKVERVRQVLPDAVFTDWEGIDKALTAAAAAPAPAPAPGSVFAAYADRPLAGKLGIKPGMTVALVRAPGDIERILGTLPEDVRLRSDARGAWDLMLWFVRSAASLRRDLPARARGCRAPMWIVWPKKGGGVDSDVTQPRVREAGLAAGLVDYKVCSVDATWSGLLFRRRR